MTALASASEQGAAAAPAAAMTASCRVSDLTLALERAVAVLDSHAPAGTPAAMVRLQAEPERLIVGAADPVRGARCATAIEAAVSRPGTVLLPPSPVGYLLRALSPDRELLITASSRSRVRLSCGTAELTVAGLAPDEATWDGHAASGRQVTLELARADLKAALTTATTVALRRPGADLAHLRGVHLAAVGDAPFLGVQGADGHRAACRIVPIITGADLVDDILPVEITREIANRLGPEGAATLTVDREGGWASIAAGATTWTTSLCSERFPSLDRVQPSKRAAEYGDALLTALVPAEPFKRALALAYRIDRILDDKGKIADARAELGLRPGALTVAARNTTAEQHSSVEIPMEYDGPDLDLTVNARYAAEAVADLAGAGATTIALVLTGPAHPIRFGRPENVDHWHVIMPIWRG